MTTKIDASKRILHTDVYDYSYTQGAFVNADSIDISGDSRMNRAWVIHNAGFIQAIVFAEYYAYTDQDALDAAADAGKLDFLQITDAEMSDYIVGTDSEGYAITEGIINLGNASEPFDSENLDYFVVSADVFAFDPFISNIVGVQILERTCEQLKFHQTDVLNAKHIEFDDIYYDEIGESIAMLEAQIKQLIADNTYSSD